VRCVYRMLPGSHSYPTVGDAFGPIILGQRRRRHLGEHMAWVYSGRVSDQSNSSIGYDVWWDDYDKSVRVLRCEMGAASQPEPPSDAVVLQITSPAAAQALAAAAVADGLFNQSSGW